MSLNRRRFWVAAAALMAASTAFAAYPEKPITMIVPFPAGGPTDALARLLALNLSQELGQTVIVDNRGGAGGVIATQTAASSKADGYTVFFATTGTMTINPALYKTSLKLDPLKAFDPVGTAVLASSVLVVSKGAPYSGVRDIISAAKAKPGKLTFASSGNGGVIHLMGELFKDAAGIKIGHIPYKGSAPAITDLITERVTMMFDVTPGSMPFIASGKLKALAVTTRRRIPALPDVPTVAESGLPQFEASSWFGLVAPKGTPSNAMERLHAGLQKVLGNGDVQKQLVALGAEAYPGSPADFSKLLWEDTAKWTALVKSSGATID
ncbi:Bug family tripartite tricarboxylate transporter substrate binding protein [Caenimonas soli]|uniref:Bug family tripartite tricarboxylate transporter substrate binding protein n=1 Tax=Caenimonas soli TaxID=2735555 RepID=UPI0015522C38|nr:tripartite tricarboxylate transporter substrate binding protein [Caenimonas soli]NPC58467.1 tripartite tricarboxylate transporter substrate binding protein [Caenimonas soli]